MERSFTIGLNRWGEGLMFIVVSAFAILSLVELSARQTAAVFLEIQQEQLLERLLQLTGKERESTAASPDGPSKLEEEIIQARSHGGCLQALEAELQVLEINGSLETNKVGSIILQAKNGCRGGLAKEQQASPLSGHAIVDAAVAMLLIPQRLVERVSSELLIALAAVMCGIIGVFVADLRRSRHQTIRHLLLGMSAGLVIFIGVKGGRVIFLLDGNSGPAESLNPYSVAFAGLLAGLFTERAYELLSDLVTIVSDRMRAAVANPTNPVSQSGAPGNND